MQRIFYNYSKTAHSWRTDISAILHVTGCDGVEIAEQR